MIRKRVITLTTNALFAQQDEDATNLDVIPETVSVCCATKDSSSLFAGYECIVQMACVVF